MTWVEELADRLGIDLNSPENLAAKAEAKARYARSLHFPCAYGNCTVDFDPVEKRITGGFGPVGCACENTPGWDADHPESRGKPTMAWKAIGRHGSRVQRSRRRHAGIGANGIMDWMTALIDTTAAGDSAA